MEAAASLRLGRWFDTALAGCPELRAFVCDAGGALACFSDDGAVWLSSALTSAIDGGVALADDVQELLAATRAGPASLAVSFAVGDERLLTGCRAMRFDFDSRSVVVAAHTLIGDSALRTLLEALPQCLWTLRVDGSCEFLSPRWLAATGVPAAVQLGEGPLSQVHAEDRPEAERLWASARGSGEAAVMEFRVRMADGSHRWFQCDATPIRSAGGRIQRWLATVSDVDELRTAQAELQQTNTTLTARVAERTADLEVTLRQLAQAQTIAHVGSGSLNLTTGAVTWSDELFHIFGVPLGRPLSIAEQEPLFTPASWQEFRAAIDAARAGTAASTALLELVRPSGERRFVNARARTDGSGADLCLAGTFHDITDLVVARRAIDDTVERLRLATAAGGVGTWDWDIAAKHIHVDERMYEIWDCPDRPTDMLALWRTRIHPDDRESVEATIVNALESGAYNAVFRIVHRDGSIHHVSSTATVIRSADGTATRMIGVNQDITRERETELALRSNLVLDEFVRRAPASITMLDRDLNIIQASDTWKLENGVSGRDVTGLNFSEVSRVNPPHWREIQQHVLRGNVERCDAEPLIDRLGSVIWIQWESRPWRLSDGAIGGIVYLTNDITVMKSLEHQLQKQKAELQRSNHDLEQFASAASHDLQEPLRAVAGCAQLLERKYGHQIDAEATELIQHIVDGAERMRTLIRDILVFARVRRDNAEPGVFDVREVVDSALANVAAAVADARAAVHVGALPAVPADRALLTQVFQNLIGNAVKYRSPARRLEVEIGVGERDTAWEFFVKDNGIGIEPRFHQQIFGLFQRLHTRAAFPGSGIGLALCQRIVILQGGRIWVESVVDQGSCFFFTVPKVRPS